jgi:uncharacterized protein DUF664
VFIGHEDPLGCHDCPGWTRCPAAQETENPGERMGRSPEESFQLADDDTVTSAKAAHWQACATARAAVADHSLDAVVTRHRSVPHAPRHGRLCRRAEPTITKPGNHHKVFNIPNVLSQ